jgi:hypothetical protein
MELIAKQPRLSVALIIIFLAFLPGCESHERPPAVPSLRAADTLIPSQIPDSSPTVAVPDDSSELQYFADVNPSLKQDEIVLAYLRKHVLRHPDDMRFIEIRDRRRRIAISHCDGGMIAFRDSLRSGNTYAITITSRTFDSARHRIGWERDHAEPKYRWVGWIDGRRFYGTDGTMPQDEFDSFIVTINGRDIDIPKGACSRFYNPNFCSYFGGGASVEAYESSDGRHLYIYMGASDGAGAYSIKWVFDHKRWLTYMVGLLDFSGNEMMDGLNTVGMTWSDVN